MIYAWTLSITQKMLCQFLAYIVFRMSESAPFDLESKHSQFFVWLVVVFLLQDSEVFDCWIDVDWCEGWQISPAACLQT